MMHISKLDVVLLVFFIIIQFIGAHMKKFLLIVILIFGIIYWP